MPLLTRNWVIFSVLYSPNAGTLANFGLGMVALFAGVHAFQFLWGLPLQSLFQALGVYAAISILVLIQLRHHVPRKEFGAANRITLARAVIVALFAGVVGHSSMITDAGLWLLLSLAATAFVFDGIDGWIARRLNIQSAFGAGFDMEVDAAFILILAVLVWEYDKVGAWVLLAGVMRYLFMIASWPVHALRRSLPPSRLRQAACATQSMALLFALCPIVEPFTASSVNGVALSFLIISFGRDIFFLLTTTSPTGDSL
ncbi:MAG TPA: CDP-alcohol phosphatidyltransferase family protein [Alphaproteobacteria bacterium]|nr:CDP-alcohol phosphatidyltransferase family protein [Alphaproteobacteria bacterium]